MLKRTFATAATALLLSGWGASAMAADYKIDTEGQHAFVQFKISHLGYSYILGEFRDFSGTFSYDPDNLEASKAELTVQTGSLYSNHAERDKHLMSADFLDAGTYPTATFVSTGFTPDADDPDEGTLTGDLTLHGVTKQIELEVERIGGGDDPWGGYRQGFETQTRLELADYGIDMSSFPEPMHYVDLYITFEGLRQ